MGDSLDLSAVPIHTVILTDYYISKYEVTQDLWNEVMSDMDNPSKFKGKNSPVENVSWYDAVIFCNAYSLKEGRMPCYNIQEDGDKMSVSCDFTKNGYRLPTEAEWEYAARDGVKNKEYLYAGSSNADEVAWSEENSNYRTHEVNSKMPNALGLFNMSGNVMEWCWDLYGTYRSIEQTDPLGATTGTYRIVRGGSWNISKEFSSVFYRIYLIPADRFNSVGFRLVYKN